MIKRFAKILLFAVLAIIIGLLILVAIYWAPDREVNELTKWQSPNSEFINIQGMQAHVVQSKRCADNKAINNALVADVQPFKNIVLLHGTSASLHTWEGWTRKLGDNYCIVSMDLPGFGLTGPYVDPATKYTSANYAAFVIGVLDKLDIESFSLAGNSLGGKIAWRTAALYPERVDHLILVDAVGYPAAPKNVPLGFKLARYPILEPILGRILPRSVVEKSIMSVYADPSKVNDELVDRYYDLATRAGNRGALSYRLKDFDNTADQEQIKQLSLPTLIMWGVQDDLIPVENAALFYQNIANSQLHVFNDLGHVPHEEDPIATAAVVKQFLAETE